MKSDVGREVAAAIDQSTTGAMKKDDEDGDVSMLRNS